MTKGDGNHSVILFECSFFYETSYTLIHRYLKTFNYKKNQKSRREALLWKICHWVVLIFLLYNKFACCICRLVLEAMDGRFLNDSYQRPCPKAGPDAAPKQPVSQRTLKVIILLYGRLCFILRPKVCKGIIYHDKNHQSK